MKLRTIFLFTLILILSFKYKSSQAQDIFTMFNKKYDAYKKSAPNERIHIITDRDLYAPGEMIWFNAFVFDIFSPRISLKSELITLSLFNKESMEILIKEFVLHDGRVDGFIKLPDRLGTGVYYLRGKTKNSGELNYFYKKIAIQDKVVPQFVIKAKFADKKYFPGDEIPLSIDFLNFYNEPLKTVNYRIDLFDAEKKVSESMGKVKKTGNIVTNIKVPRNLNSGLFSYEISADSKGASAQLKGKLPVISDKLFIDFYPAYGKIINVLETDINFYTYDACGDPLAIEADLFENNKKVSTIHSETNGMGSFKLSPRIDHAYHVQIIQPVMLENKFELPSVEAKGIALEEITKTSSELKYKLINGYDNARLVYLIGVSDGEIFWASEHEFEKELILDIDISKATGRLMHFVVSNAAFRIEGEQIVVKSGNEPGKLMADINSEKASKISPVEVEINSQALGAGSLFLSAVNTPWIVGELFNQHLLSVGLPFDIGQQIILESGAFHRSDFSDQTLEAFAKYYVPYAFGWDRVLNRDGAFTHNESNSLVFKNKGINDQLTAGRKSEMREGKIIHSNSNADNYFITANPKYISKLYLDKKERTPAYKTMLENGYPVMDVLKTIKPYSLGNSKIIFSGSNNSFNAQGGALVVIDGVNRGTDASHISNLSPYAVDEIFVSTKPIDIQKYTGLNSVGLIEITLKKGDVAEFEREADLNEDTQFEAPEYENGKGDLGNDFRSTLYWAPKIAIDNNGKSKLVFYNSNLISNVNGKIYFVPTQGQLSVLEFDYTIR